MEERDECVTARVTSSEKAALDCNPSATLQDFLPPEYDWLLDKVLE